jgi:Tfp pilus assembly protein PilZ
MVTFVDFSARAANIRCHQRVQAREVSARLSVPDTKILVAVANLSKGGIFAKTSSLFDVGTELELELAASGVRTRVKMTAEVVNVVTELHARRNRRVAGMGLRFTKVSLTEQDAIADFLARLVSSGAHLLEGSPEHRLTVPAPRTPSPEALSRQAEPARIEVVQEAQLRQLIQAQQEKIHRLQEELEALRGGLVEREMNTQLA